MRTSRSRVARLALNTLVPLLKAQPLVAATALMPAHRELKIRGLEVMLTERWLALPTDNTLVSMIDIWQVNGNKVLSVTFEPLNIVAYKVGDWVEIITDLAYETSGARA